MGCVSKWRFGAQVNNRVEEKERQREEEDLFPADRPNEHATGRRDGPARRSETAESERGIDGTWIWPSVGRGSYLLSLCLIATSLSPGVNFVPWGRGSNKHHGKGPGREEK